MSGRMQAPGPCGFWCLHLKIPMPLLTYHKTPSSHGRDISSSSTPTGVPKGKGCESLSPYSPVRACPQFLILSFCIIIIGLISKENKSIFTREGRHPQKAKIMTVCSLQETLIKLDLPSVQASASFQEELWCEAERRGSPFQATCGQQRD